MEECRGKRKWHFNDPQHLHVVFCMTGLSLLSLMKFDVCTVSQGPEGMGVLGRNTSELERQVPHFGAKPADVTSKVPNASIPYQN